MSRVHPYFGFDNVMSVVSFQRGVPLLLRVLDESIILWSNFFCIIHRITQFMDSAYIFLFSESSLISKESALSYPLQLCPIGSPKNFLEVVLESLISGCAMEAE